MAVPPHGYLRIQPDDPARRRHRVDVCGARGRSRVGEAARGRRRQRQRRGCLGRQRHGAGRALRVSPSWSSFCSRRAPTRTRPRPASPRCTRRSCAATRRWSARSSPTAPIRTLRFGPGRRRAARRTTSISRPHWSARRRSGWPPVSAEPGVMRLLVEARRRSAVRAPWRPHGARREAKAFSTGPRSTTALMAATGMGGGRRLGATAPRAEREALTLEAVKLAVELGVDVNAANTDGRTALDAAKALKYDRRQVSGRERRQARQRRRRAIRSGQRLGSWSDCPALKKLKRCPCAHGAGALYGARRLHASRHGRDGQLSQRTAVRVSVTAASPGQGQP